MSPRQRYQYAVGHRLDRELFDPDGHLWEVAHNPFMPLDPDGGVQLPPPA